MAQVGTPKKQKYTLLQNMAYILKGVRKTDPAIFGYFILYTICTAVTPLVFTYLPTLLIDELMGARRTEYFAALLGGTLLLTGTMGFFSRWSHARASLHAVHARLDFLTRLLYKHMAMDFPHTEDPKVLDRSKSTWGAIGSNQSGIEGILNTLFGLLGQMITLAAYAYIVYTLHPLILLMLVGNVLISYRYTKAAKSYQYARRDVVAANDRRADYLYGTMYNFQYGKDLRLYDLGRRLADRFHEIRLSAMRLEKDIRKRHLRATAIDALLLFPRNLLLYAYLIWRAVQGTLSVGEMVLYFATASNLGEWLRQIMEHVANMQEQSRYVSDFREFMEIDQDKEAPQTLPIPKAKTHRIAFERVSFRYPGTERWIFRDLSLTLEKGQRLAVVGVNGAGKTTLVKLLCRLYDPDEGRITLDGIDIRRFDKEEYYRAIGAVFQEVKLLAMSAAENVAMLPREKIDRERAKAALAAAGLSKKMGSLPNGMDTELLKNLKDDGIELSGGENQRLALARAIYKDAPVMVLDEPTAALDPLAEYEMYVRFDTLIGGRSAIYISHRLASTRFCDRILFFENGQILEEGTHEELLRANGRYREMFDVQAQYYREEGKTA